MTTLFNTVHIFKSIDRRFPGRIQIIKKLYKY